MKVRSRSLKAVVLATGSLLAKLAGVLSAVVLTRVLTKDDYSTYRQALLAYGLAAPFLALGLPRALYFFLPGEKERPGGVLLENFLLLAFMGLLFMAGLWWGGADLLAWRFNNPALASSLLLFAPFAFFMLPQGAFSSCLMARDRVGLVAVTLPLSRLLMAAAVVAAALATRDADGALVGAVAGAALVAVPIIYLMFRVCRGGSWRISGEGMRSQLRYSIPLGVTAIVAATAGNVDQLLVSSLGTPEQFAVYVNGATKLPLVGIVTGSVVSVLLPDMARHYKAGELREAIGIWQRGAVKCGLALIPAAVLLLATAPDLMVLLFTEAYRDSAIPFAWYALLLPLSSISFGAPLLAAGRTRLALVEALVGLALNFGLTIVAIKVFGYFGAAAATVATSYLWAAGFNAVMISRTYRVPLRALLPLGPLLRILGIALLASVCFLPLLWPLASPLLRLVVTGLPFGALVVALYLRTGMISTDAWRRALRRIGRRDPRK